jgi:hypothetical protein
MPKHGCLREDDVLTALQSPRWREDSEPSLRAHIDGCASCRQLVDLAEALLDDHHALVAEAQVPSSAIVWWRAQMRSRREAAQAVTHPITFVQGLILACAAGVTVAAAGVYVPTFRRSFQWLSAVTESLPSVSLSLPPQAMTHPIVIAVTAAVVLCAIVLPLALYFTFQEEE